MGEFVDHDARHGVYYALSFWLWQVFGAGALDESAGLVGDGVFFEDGEDHEGDFEG
jgi:hypothetical protein